MAGTYLGIAQAAFDLAVSHLRDHRYEHTAVEPRAAGVVAAHADPPPGRIPNEAGRALVDQEANLLGHEGDQIWYVFEVVAPYFLVAMAGTYLGIAPPGRIPNEAGRALVDQEAGEGARIEFGTRRHGRDHVGIGMLAAGDETLRSVHSGPSPPASTSPPWR
jgi:hypothetical protein